MPLPPARLAKGTFPADPRLSGCEHRAGARMRLRYGFPEPVSAAGERMPSIG